MIRLKKISTVLLFNLALLSAAANNITVSNVNIASVNTVSDFAMIRFNISWENSWRDAANRDAAWIFIKFHILGEPDWRHATLSSTGHISPGGSSYTIPADGKGAFIYRTANGSGTVNYTAAELRWDYGADGVNDFVSAEIFMAAIEMVYVPGGSFWLGDGSIASLNGQFEAGNTGAAFQVNSENAVTLGGGAAGSLGNNNRTGMANNGLFSIPVVSIDDFDDVTAQTLPAAFPKGFNGFYCMKYEITQGQYTDFLNKLTAAQFATRYDAANYTTSHGGNTATRYNITGTHPNMTTVTPNLAAVYIEWYDVVAYADWSGLRPMTELEFEKACRGSAAPVAGEFAWGTTGIATATYFTINNQGLPNESIGANYSTTVGNAWYDQTRAFDRITRVGIFSAHPSNTGRVSAGATYWGIMEMSGHCWERCVSVGRTESRNYQGTHGDGSLMANGNASNSDWPGYTSGMGVNTAVGGGGYRGGGFNFPNPIQPNLRISSRIVATAFYNTRYYDDSGRLVRTTD